MNSIWNNGLSTTPSDLVHLASPFRALFFCDASKPLGCGKKPHCTGDLVWPWASCRRHVESYVRTVGNATQNFFEKSSFWALTDSERSDMVLAMQPLTRRETFRHALKITGVSIDCLAEELGMNPRHIAEWVSSKKSVRPVPLMAAIRCGIWWEDFMGASESHIREVPLKRPAAFSDIPAYHILNFTQNGTHWIYRGCNAHGYGFLRHCRKRIMAHRLVYEACFGKIPDGMTLDHLCRVRRCSNPNHLEVVTQGENTRRMNAVKRGDAPKFPMGNPKLGPWMGSRTIFKYGINHMVKLASASVKARKTELAMKGVRAKREKAKGKT